MAGILTVLKRIKAQAYQVVFLQLMIVIALALVLLLWHGMQAGFALLMGGLAYWLPTLLFVWRIFTHKNIQRPKQFLVMFFAGETVKLIMSSILFLLIINYLSVAVLPVLIGFVSAIVAFWVASIIFFSRNQGVRANER